MVGAMLDGTNIDAVDSFFENPGDYLVDILEAQNETLYNDLRENGVELDVTVPIQARLSETNI
jgi:hypothetical protein